MRLGVRLLNTSFKTIRTRKKKINLVCHLNMVMEIKILFLAVPVKVNGVTYNVFFKGYFNLHNMYIFQSGEVRSLFKQHLYVA